MLSKKQVEALLFSLDSQLSSLSEMAMMNLQDATSKQAQATQIMSSMMKMMHDTLKAIIENMK